MRRANVCHPPRDEKGFSLVELITVVAIIGILTAVAIPIFNGIQKKSLDNAIRTSTHNVATYAVSAYLETGAVQLPPNNFFDPDSYTVVVVSDKRNNPFSICAIAVGPDAPTAPALYSGPGCDRYDWGAANPRPDEG